ncbi:MAG: hypothetical protein HYS07_09655 [Chlamydiae bacterium]|nr:hypothetical protein [Chlamydiota bacterium]MBI3277103.1 hypothetical protein [Chlamydiota bacterium]
MENMILNMKRPVLYPKFKTIGAHFQEHQGWDLPCDFGSLLSEWEAVRTQTGILDFSYRGKILVTGKDRMSFLHSMLSNDIKNLAMGSSCYATLLTPKGKIISDLHVFALKDQHLLELDEANLTKVVEHLSKFMITEEVELKNASDLFGILSIQGPRSNEIVQKLSLHQSFFSHERCSREGFDLIIPIENLEKVWDEIQLQEKIQPIGLSAYNMLRIESGIPLFGSELDEGIIPNEANLEKAISWTKGCYPGQEIVARIKYRGGIKRNLCGILLHENSLPQKSDSVFSGDDEIGFITSSTYSLLMKSNIALAFLKVSTTLSDKKIEIHHGEEILKGIVQILPFQSKI